MSGQAADYYNSDPNAQKAYPPQGQGTYYNAPQQQSYAPPNGGQQGYPPPPNYGQNFNNSGDQKLDFNSAFKVEKPKFNDLWAAILFWLVFIGFTAVSGISIQGYSAEKGYNGGGIYNSRNRFGLNTNTIVLFAFVLAVALILGYVYVSLARIFTKQFIWITGILNIVFCFVTAFYMLARKYWSGGIVFLIFGIFAIVCFISWIPRIPFSVLMLQSAIDVSRRFGHVYMVSFIGGLIAAAFGAWFAVTLVAIYAKYQPGNTAACSQGAGGCSWAKVIGLVAFITFAGYWITEVLKNVIHTTISGVYGSWYFAPNNPPKAPTRGAAKRALTYSFGSISFGSLLVAIINCLRQLCSIAQQSEAADGNIAGQIGFCILGCFIGLLDWAVQFINRYAFSYMALYGKSYIQSAKDTWTMIKSRGIDALINECLIGPVLSMGATFVAYACALLAYLYLSFTKPAYNTDGSFTPVVIAYSFLIGLQIAQCFTVPLSSGIDTIFVAMAWDPAVLQREHPELYSNMVLESLRLHDSFENTPTTQTHAVVQMDGFPPSELTINQRARLRTVDIALFSPRMDRCDSIPEYLTSSASLVESPRSFRPLIDKHKKPHQTTSQHHHDMSAPKKGIHFGGGNIGRGFVAELLHNSGFEVVFVDVVDALIDNLKKTKSYEVTEIGEEGERKFHIDNYRALNSKHEMEQVIHEIATADTVTCAVGPNILKFIAEPIAKGIEARTKSEPLAVIACENMIGGTDALKGFIEAKLSEDGKKSLGTKAHFANSAIDRIVPVQPADAGLNVLIESFYEWCVEEKPFKGNPPAIKGVHFVDDLQPYIERKLFTVNTGHATAAYYGYNRGKKYIHEVLADKELHDIVRATLSETAHLVCTKHSHISREEQAKYVDAIVERISNPTLKDEVPRVGRAPLRKLSRKERFIGPAAHLAENGDSVEHLLGGIEMALRFQNVAGDDESAELAKKLQSLNSTEATKDITGLEESHPLFKLVEEKVKKVQSEKASLTILDRKQSIDIPLTPFRLALTTIPLPTPHSLQHPRLHAVSKLSHTLKDGSHLENDDPEDSLNYMAIGQNPYFSNGEFVKPQKRFWPLKIPVSHWQLRHFISHSEPDHIYYASKAEVYRLNTATKKRKLITKLPFDARCTASGYGWVCVGGGDENGHFAAIKLDGSGDVDAPLPIDSWRTGRRAPSVKIESIGEEIVNSISVHRIQDEEAHLDDIVAVVTNNDKTVRIYSLPQGMETKTLHLPDPMNHATISPCGTMLVAVGDHNQAFFYERVLNEKPPLIPKPHNRLTSAHIGWKLLEVCELFVHKSNPLRGYFTTAWSPDGRYVAVGSEGCYITLLDVETLRARDSAADPVVTVIPSSRAGSQSYAGSIRSMMFSPSPWDLLIWAEDQGRVCIGDLRSGLQRTQVLHLNSEEDGLEKVNVEDVPTDSATQDEMEQVIQASQRNLEDLDYDFIQQYRHSHSGNFPSNWLLALTRYQLRRHESSQTRRTEQLVDDPGGLSADEQQILQTLRTTRQREENRAGGRAPNTNYTTADALMNRSSASSTPITADSSARPINDILTSVQESLPELARTHAHNSRSLSAHAAGSRLSAAELDEMSGWMSRYSARPYTPTQGDRASEAQLRQRRRMSALLNPQEARYEDLFHSQTTTLAHGGRHTQMPNAANAEADNDYEPWRTIQDAMAATQGPLFESAARAPALPSPSRHSTTETTELAAIQALTRRRNHLRAARLSLSQARNGSISAGNERIATTTMPDAYELFRRRMTPYGREMGVRTAGLAMSRDGSILWAASEEGIFEFQMNNKARMFWPAVVPR
ncbi:hypothetical protein AMS68_006419 [Peltaster fructicola]|uniref:Mannitol-1-phosphate 5-dehydrogenase n=1 Tax=Peltaster fructicola TaxID=286661 RepID=A0A6H0Y1J2_9PEZI|nr:hypothetical protein AMS68_006419 [Peltaster fructicola]